MQHGGPDGRGPAKAAAGPDRTTKTTGGNQNAFNGSRQLDSISNRAKDQKNIHGILSNQIQRTGIRRHV